MEKHYLVLAEQISFRNDKLTVLNVLDQFTALHLPAKFNFDLVYICGPGWKIGEHCLTFKVKSDAKEEFELGSIKINIIDGKSVFNAIASNLNFVIGNDSGNVTFIVEREGKDIFSREYPVAYLLKTNNQKALA